MGMFGVGGSVGSFVSACFHVVQCVSFVFAVDWCACVCAGWIIFWFSVVDRYVYGLGCFEEFDCFVGVVVVGDFSGGVYGADYNSYGFAFLGYVCLLFSFVRECRRVGNFVVIECYGAVSFILLQNSRDFLVGNCDYVLYLPDF